MEKAFVDPKYEFEAPHFVNFKDMLGGMVDEDANVDSWFDTKPDDEGGIQIPTEFVKTEEMQRQSGTLPTHVVGDVAFAKKEAAISPKYLAKPAPQKTENIEISTEASDMNKKSQSHIDSVVKVENIEEITSETTTTSEEQSACELENNTGSKSVDDEARSEEGENKYNGVDFSEVVVKQDVQVVVEKNDKGSKSSDVEKVESDVESQKESQAGSSQNTDTTEDEAQKHEPRKQEKRVTRSASKRNRSLNTSSDIPSKRKKQTRSSAGSVKGRRSRSISSNPERKSAPITVPVTPQCLKRQKTNKPSMIKLKTTEELEMECIAKLRKKTKHHIKVNENLMKKAISCPAVGATRAHGASLTQPQEFHFQTDRRVKPHPMTTRVDQASDTNGEDTEKEFWNSLRQHPPSPSWKNRTATVPKPFNLSDGSQKKRKHSAMEDVAASETDSYQSMALQVYKFQTTTPPRFRTRKANDNVFKFDAEKAAAPKVTQPKTPNLSTKTRSRPVAHDVLSKEAKEEKELEEMKSYKFKAKPFDRRIIEGDGMYGVKKPEEQPALTKFKPFAFESDERVVARKEKEPKKEEETMNFKALPQPNFEKVFRPQLKHEKTAPKPFSFDEKDKERWQKKDGKIQEVYKEEERLREFKAQPLPSDSPDPLPAVASKCGTSFKPFALNTESRGAKKAERWIQKVRSELEECRNKATFKAKPAKVVHDAPFVPQKSTKPLTEVSEFTLNTNQRAERHEELDTVKKEREMINEDLRREREAEWEREEEEAIALLRKQMVHKAQPVHNYKNVKVKPSSKPLTEAHSPAWSEIKRRRIESHR